MPAINAASLSTIKPSATPSDTALAAGALTEIYQGQTIEYQTNQQGQLVAQGNNSGPTNMLDKSLAFGKRLIFPPNMETSVSKDYLATRGWQIANIFTRDAAGFAIGAVALSTLVGDPSWGAAVKGGAAMATFGLIKTYTCQATKFAASFQIDKAEKNPRAWMLASEMVCNFGTVVGALGSLKQVTDLVPGGLLGVTVACAAISTVGGVMRGAATANVTRRQALDGNLAQVNAANGNQEMLTGFASGMAGAALLAGINKYTNPAISIPIVAATVGIIGAVCISQWVKNLDYHPVTETVLRDVMAGVDSTGKVPAPKPDEFIGMMKELTKDGIIELGENKHPATQARLEELKSLHQGRNYLMDIEQGKPYVMLRDKCTVEDRFQAVYQVLQAEKLMASAEYQSMAQDKGKEAADRWAVSQSIQHTPADPKPFLKQMHDSGWSIDVMKFNDSGRRIRW